MQEYLKYFISYVVRINGVPCMSNGLIDRLNPITTYEDIKEVEEDIRIEQKADSALLISFSLLNSTAGREECIRLMK